MAEVFCLRQQVQNIWAVNPCNVIGLGPSPDQLASSGISLQCAGSFMRMQPIDFALTLRQQRSTPALPQAPGWYPGHQDAVQAV
jgi:hypothetical protein